MTAILFTPVESQIKLMNLFVRQLKIHNYAHPDLKKNPEHFINQSSVFFPKLIISYLINSKYHNARLEWINYFKEKNETTDPILIGSSGPDESPISKRCKE